METTQAMVDALNSELDSGSFSLGEDLTRVTLDDLLHKYGEGNGKNRVVRVGECRSAILRVHD